jgi:hypothetical protein
MTTQATPYFGFGLVKRPHLSGRESAPNLQHMQRWLPDIEAADKEPFVGLTTDGHVIPGLFPLGSTGVSTRPLTLAAQTFLSSLVSSQRAQVSFPIDSREWQRWFNISPALVRHGILLESLSDRQLRLAMDMLAAALSAPGFESIRNVMRLNYTIGEITGQHQEYGEWCYFLSIFGDPSEDGPWGWQIDGHHLNLHCFVLGDQMVLTPAFLGSEPVIATTGKFAGLSVLQAEQDAGLAFMQTLTPEQRALALAAEAPGHQKAGAFRDNLVLPYEGLPFTSLQPGQQQPFFDVLDTYVGYLRSGHAEIRMDEIKRHLDDTYFRWTGEVAPDGVFGYRIHSPVVLIEFDHQSGVAFDNKVSSRNHIHTIVRTPNGNDYGKDLLRQHLAESHRK